MIGSPGFAGYARTPMMSPFVLWVFTLLTFLSPPEKDAAVKYRGFNETAEARQERYKAIATDLAEVLNEEPPLPGKTEAQTAAVVVAIAFYESGFAPDVDSRTCPKDRCGFRGGRQVCLMQLYYPYGVDERDGYAMREVVEDRRQCFRAALAIIRASWARCQAPDTRLNAYASGSCAVGTANTRMKLATAQQLLRKLPYAP